MFDNIKYALKVFQTQKKLISNMQVHGNVLKIYSNTKVFPPCLVQRTFAYRVMNLPC